MSPVSGFEGGYQQFVADLRALCKLPGLAPRRNHIFAEHGSSETERGWVILPGLDEASKTLV